MTILFDLFLIDPTLLEDLSEDENTFYSEFHNFIEQRLNVLRDEIEAEETANPGQCAFVVNIISEPSGFVAEGYSKPLRERIFGCFSEQDIDYMLSIIRENLTRRKN